MDENISDYKDLIHLMAATPKVPVPNHFTQSVMGRLAGEQSLSIWQLVRRTLGEAGEISWANFTATRADCWHSGISLIAGGMMMATNIPGTLWAKRAIMFYGILMIAEACLIDAAVKTTSGGLLALTFGMAGIVTGMTLMKALEKRTQGNNETFTGELHNA